MENAETEIFSQRIVIADYYMVKPVYGLDPTYSEFRGQEINKVPVIRIFGTSKAGEKICMHVHGVFPYFYIPYELADVGDPDQAVYLIASSIDKAVNISLGKGSSTNSHVFKIQLVKGIPFYGYHKSEHQFLKIYLYNPRFIKRVANLFQNGAIMGKMFQPHESHVPFILQFFIDYDLYGMSFLHIPKNVLKYRRKENGDIPELVNADQVLSEKVVRMSTSLHEVDIAAAFILNRFQTYDENAQCANPGIEAIWQDERMRRKEVGEEMPSLEAEPSVPRIDAQPTESNDFYLTALRKKLDDDALSQTNLSVTFQSEDLKKNTFNLTKLLSNSVYPSECSQEKENITDASAILDHLSVDSSMFYTSLRSRTASTCGSNDDNFLDESIVLSLSQKSHDITLQPQDLDLLAVMEKLEDDDAAVDADSTLAPLSQNTNLSVVTKEDDAKILLNATLCGESDNEETEDCLDYTFSLDDVDQNYFQNDKCSRIPKGKEANSQDIPQMDGANDIMRTPPKRTLRRKLSIRNTSPKKSVQSKYTPLNIKTIVSPKSRRKLNEAGSCEENKPTQNERTNPELIHNFHSKKLIVKVRKRLEMVSKEDDVGNDSFKSTVTCNLRTPKTMTPQEKRLKMYKTENCLEIKEKNENINVPKTEFGMRACKVRLKKLAIAAKVEPNPSIEDVNTRELRENDRQTIELHANEPNEQLIKWSPSNIARDYDVKRDFFPQPGPSGVKRDLKQNKSPQTKNDDNESLLSTPNTPKSVMGANDDDLNIFSFYEKSFILDSPVNFSIENSQQEYKDLTSPKSHKGICSIVPDVMFQIITPEILPPTYEEVKQNLVNFDIPLVTYTKPFYGDYADVTTKKEVGHMILHIPGKSLNDLEEFTSSIPNLNGINNWRRKMLEAMSGGEVSNNFKCNNSVREYFADKRRLVITPLHEPPKRNDASVWLKARKLYIKQDITNDKSNDRIGDEDSPIKVRREKIKTVVIESSESDDNSVIENSFSLSPLTPVHNNIKQGNSFVKDTIACSPLSLTVLNVDKLMNKSETPEKGSTYTPITIKRNENLKMSGSSKTLRSNSPHSISVLRSIRRNRQSKARLSLARKLNKINVDALRMQNEILEQPPPLRIKVISPEKILDPVKTVARRLSNVSVDTTCSDSTEDSVKSEAVMKILERSSFVKNLNLDDKIRGHNDSFQLSGTVMNDTYGFKVKYDNLQQAKTDIEYNYLTILVVEVFTPTRKDLKPNPEFDPVMGLFYSVINNAPKTDSTQNKFTGVVLVSSNEPDTQFLLNYTNVHVTTVESEPQLFNHLTEICRYWDPDILAGYEIEMQSWGYLMERSTAIAIDLPQMLSRVPSQKIYARNDEENEHITEMDIELKLCGRILLDVWRLLRSEIALTSYTFENVVYHILHKRCPNHSFLELTRWYSLQPTRWIVIEYYLERVRGTLDILDQLDLIGRTSEMAKLIGIQFYEVLSRGSQFRVESMMLRVAKPKNLVPVSPSVKQRAHMRAPEYLPLILEPESRMYTDPIIVLDFQSLYPSIMIAYNYCFSTCLGRVEHLGQTAPFEFGASQLRISQTDLKKMLHKNLVTSSPGGIIFVKSSVREGVLPRLVKELLDTRIMVKQSMKIHKDKLALQKILHSRQLAIKLIANVTYGYTAANFSGRMPCVEVGDSIVAKGRETLERAIKLIEANENWRAKVVYGDTDSMFVLVKGRSREDAFRIGAEIAESVTNDNPKPVKLKLEKVYQPCILQTKKRYVGFMYESADQTESVYEAKGIETVRRDGCPIVAKMLEKVLRILFATCDVSEIKKYVCRQFTKLLTGHANIQDLIFAKEFRGRNGYKPGACVPALELTRRWMQNDPRNEPRRGERVPYLIVNGPPGVPLIRLVRSPHEYLSDEGLKINAMYYITKAIIPPINRCMLLIGADLHEWFSSLPRKYIVLPKMSNASDIASKAYLSKKSTISQYFSSANCIIDCGRQTKHGVCQDCRKDAQKCVHVLSTKKSMLERKFYMAKKLCESCCGRMHDLSCQSLDCPVLYARNNRERQLKEFVHLECLVRDISLDALYIPT